VEASYYVKICPEFDIIRNACAQAKPDRDFTKERVRLIDVLWLIPADEIATGERQCEGNVSSDYVDKVFQTVYLWDQSRDDLSQQSPAMLKFLADLVRLSSRDTSIAADR
jgi:hypothetical protein